MSEYVYLDEGLVDSAEAQVSVHDAGLLHGVGLFETMRSYNGRVFRLGDHLDRLFSSAEVLGLTITQSRQEMTDAIAELLEANGLGDDARLRLTVTRGNTSNITDDTVPHSTMVITAAGLVGYPLELYRHGMMVIISDYKQNPADPIGGHKTINFFPRLIALQQAQQKKAGEALWFTTNNRLAEGCISNVFIVQDDMLLTPPLDTPVLGGITRKVVLELARKNKIECQERELVVKDLLSASEVILTNSIMELMPVCHIEAHKVGDEKPGAVYRKLHDLYKQAVKDEL